MEEYSLILSQLVSSKTKIKVFELCKRGRSLLQDFTDEIKHDEQSKKDFSRAIRIIEDTSNLQRRPKGQFRQIKSDNINCKVYEAKAGAIRIYLFHEEKTGRIIVGGGQKGSQDKDIKKIKKTIKNYQIDK